MMLEFLQTVKVLAEVQNEGCARKKKGGVPFGQIVSTFEVLP
jgi:hypothetical protein